MTSNQYASNPRTPTPAVSRVGFAAAILTTLMTVVTFGFAIVAIPISGANCPADCIEYPYLDTVAQFPRDYLWMPAAIGLMLAYLILMTAIHYGTDPSRRIYSQLGLTFALLSTGILVSTYFVQFSVVPVSLMHGETEGITLLTQYNPHGVFIALEELGYLMMSCSFLAIALVFTQRNRIEIALRWIYLTGFALAVAALLYISLNYGLDRQDRFEVLVISINWIVLLITGGLLSVAFRRQAGDSNSYR
jgi:hypothetical protein